MEVTTFMKKKLLTTSIVFLPLILLALAGCNSQTEGFTIYLTRDDIPVSQMEALSHVEIANTPVISSKDIISYDKETHEIELKADAYERVQALQVPTSGRSFVVCVDKGPIYWGAFWIPISSQSFNGVTILIPAFSQQGNIITLELGYPSENFFTGEDPRSNSEILTSLEKAGKLK
jgi:hypothetical protein